MIDLQIINLADAKCLIEQYVDLRNMYKKELLTDIVTVSETINWLKHARVHVVVAVDCNELIGAATLYLDKNAEIAIFTKKHRSGVASALLNNIKLDARDIFLLNDIWAWIADNNVKSSNLFEKNGFIKKMSICKQYNGKLFSGGVYEYVL